MVEYCVTFPAWCPYEFPIMDLSCVFSGIRTDMVKIVLGADVFYDVRGKTADNFLDILLFLFANQLT